MKIVAVICELNPLHKGHKHVFNCAREIFESKYNNEKICVAAIMSGDFVQRGEAAIYPKHTRARAALLSGADLVLELPFPHSCSGAEDFARGACEIAKGIGASAIVFGSESGSEEYLYTAAENISASEFDLALKHAVWENQGAQYARLREKLYREMYGADLPVTPNDILAIEYIKSLKDSGVSALAVKRIEAKSASSAREIIKTGSMECLEGAIPSAAYELFKSSEPYDCSPIFFAVLAKLKLYTREQAERYKGIYALPDGMLGHLAACAEKAADVNSLLKLSATKKYTNAAIRRALIHFLTETQVSDIKNLNKFTNLLGANDIGRRALDEICKRFTVITRKSDIGKCPEDIKKAAELSVRAERIYEMGNKNAKEHTAVII